MSDTEKLWNVTFAIDGSGFARVKAKTYEEAMEKANELDFFDEPELDTWDINTQGHRGGFIDVDNRPEKIGD